MDMDIHYQTEGGGPPFICLHGGKGYTGDCFFPFLSPLADTFQMIYLDERGGGKSKPASDKNRVNYAGMAQDIDNLIAHLGARDAVVLGHSFGASLAMYFAQHYPQRVSELYLVSGGHTYDEIHKGWWQKWLAEYERDTGFAPKRQAVYDLYNSGKISADESFRRVALLGIEENFHHHKAKADILRDMYARTTLTYIGEENSTFHTENAPLEIFRRLSDIKCPTLIVMGQHEVSTPIEFFGAMARNIPDCEMRVMPRSKHFPYVDEPELFVETIRAFHKSRSLR